MQSFREAFSGRPQSSVLKTAQQKKEFEYSYGRHTFIPSKQDTKQTEMSKI